jgi:predicted MPP superfamily phosphohydrolase
MDPIRVHFNRAWIATGIVGGAAGLAALRYFGSPIAYGGAAFGLAALGHMILGEPARPQLEHVELHVRNLPPALDGLRIGQISDIHLGLLHSVRNLRWAVDQMQQERPDLIVLTGDQVMHKQAIPELTPLLHNLSAPLGVFAISGNHDHWEGIRDLQGALALANIPLLLNEHRRLSWRGADLWLVGVDDVWDGDMDFERALDGVPKDDFKLLLGHAPDIADEAETYGFNLQLAGHVHGGHLQLPLLGAFTRPRFGVNYLEGTYQVGTMTLYVSRGLGGAPLRLLCPPEVTILTLRQARC